jgi:hypothetical protein
MSAVNRSGSRADGLLTHVSKEQLQSYLNGGLSDEDSKQLKSHLDECDRCRTWLTNSRTQIQHSGEIASQTGLDERRRETRIPTSDSASVQVISPPTLEYLEVQVLDVSRNGLKIRTPKFLSLGVILRMQLRSMWIVGEVRYCVQTDDGFCVGLYIQDCVERRHEERLDVDIPATIGELLADQPARILDQSAEGMLVAARHRVPEGALVRIITEGKVIFAKVVHCNPDGERFKIGVKIDQVLNL